MVYSPPAPPPLFSCSILGADVKAVTMASHSIEVCSCLSGIHCHVADMLQRVYAWLAAIYHEQLYVMCVICTASTLTRKLIFCQHPPWPKTSDCLSLRSYQNKLTLESPLLIIAPTHSPTRSLTYSSTHSLTHAPTCSLARSVSLSLWYFFFPPPFPVQVRLACQLNSSPCAGLLRAWTRLSTSRSCASACSGPLTQNWTTSCQLSSTALVTLWRYGFCHVLSTAFCHVLSTALVTL